MRSLMSCLGLVAFAVLLWGCNSGDSGSGDPADSANNDSGAADSLPAFQRKFDWGESSEQTLGPLRVKIQSIESMPVEIRNPDDEDFGPTPESYLVIKLNLENIGEERKLEYIPWASASAAFNDLMGRLSDQNKKRYDAKTFGQGVEVQGQLIKKTSLIKGEPIDDLLIFENVASDAKVLLLELPGGGFGEKESLRFQINVPSAE